MQVGFAVPVSGAWATPEHQRRIAGLAEDAGYDSLWTFQRLLWPAEIEGDAAAPYREVLDPVATLGFLAACTERVRLGVAVLNAPFFAPALLAKQLSTLDVLSGGRLIAGLGLGWMEQEYVAAGVPMARRGARMDEYLAVLDALFTDDPVSFDGEFYRVPPTRALPKPVQRPRPPVVLGGSAAAALRRAGRLADGWVSSSRADLTTIERSIETVRGGAREAGRDPAAVRVIVRGVVRPGADPGAPLAGDYPKIRADLAELAGHGVTDVFVDLNFDPTVVRARPEEAMRIAERTLAELAPARLG